MFLKIYFLSTIAPSFGGGEDGGENACTDLLLLLELLNEDSVMTLSSLWKQTQSSTAKPQEESRGSMKERLHEQGGSRS